MQKHFLITIMLIINCLVIGKSQKLDTFSMTFKSVLKDSIDYASWTGFREEFCILKDNVELPFNAYSVSKNGKKIKVLGLTKGNYIVRYENIFRQLIDKPITITGRSHKNIPIYLDEFIDTGKISFLEDLKNGDSLGILFNERIHEGNVNDSLLITKSEGVLTAKLFKFMQNVDKNGIPTREYYYNRFQQQKLLVKIKILTNKDIALMTDIFKRLAMPPSDCQPIERDYFIYLNGKEIQWLKNDDCDWNSFDYLKEKIFDIKWNYKYYNN